jgi:hypothetical protein
LRYCHAKRHLAVAGWNKRRTIPMAEHKHGEMNTEVQEKTFEGFVRFTVWSVVVIIGILLFMALVNS